MGHQHLVADRHDFALAGKRHEEPVLLCVESSLFVDDVLRGADRRRPLRPVVVEHGHQEVERIAIQENDRRTVVRQMVVIMRVGEVAVRQALPDAFAQRIQGWIIDPFAAGEQVFQVAVEQAQMDVVVVERIQVGAVQLDDVVVEEQ